MLKALLKLVGGIVALGASVLAAVAATGVAGDGMVGGFRRSGGLRREAKGGEPQGELIRRHTEPGAACRKARGPFCFSERRKTCPKTNRRSVITFDGVPIYRVTLVRESTDRMTVDHSRPEVVGGGRRSCVRSSSRSIVSSSSSCFSTRSTARSESTSSRSASSPRQLVHPREIFKAAILANSAAIIFAHGQSIRVS